MSLLYREHEKRLITIAIMTKLSATRENRSSGFPTMSDTNLAAQLLKIARNLKFRI